ncbi:MAG: thiamine diphosphokinase [Clostridia bacterium]|nr:thiamine diphosphokinase [Clostridia bacterium]
MSNCVIIGGADINNYERVKSFLHRDDYFIYCDSGLKHLDNLGFKPSLIVGDFDSHENPNMDIETIVLPRAKDDTDTVYAAREGIKRGFESFVLIGVTGGRIDHTLGNIYLLLYLYDNGKKAVMIDEYSELSIIGTEPEHISDKYPYFSLVNIEGTAKGITIENAKFPLTDGEITTRYQYGFSNEVLPGKKAKVYTKEGTLLLIKDII